MERGASGTERSVVEGAMSERSERGSGPEGRDFL